jgi:hypothetical protein
MTNIQIANSQINAGAYVDLQATKFRWSIKRLNRTEPIIGQNPGNTSDQHLDIPEGDELSGVEAPILIINGAIDVEEFASDDDLHAISGISTVTLGYLKELARVRADSTTTLQIFFGMDNSKEFRAYDGGGEVGVGKRDITVLIESLDIVPLQDSEGHHLITYQFQMREIKS